LGTLVEPISNYMEALLVGYWLTKIGVGRKCYRKPLEEHIMKYVLFLAAMSICQVMQASDIDLRPLPVGTELAFPKLQWPEKIAGLEKGVITKVRPIVITGAGDGSNRLFVATQRGKIYVFENHRDIDSMELFLDLTDRVHPYDKENEEGFLGLAFHPQFAKNGQFFVYYTAKRPPQIGNLSIVSRFHVNPDHPQQADPNSEQILMRIDQPYWNHNGGTVVFGPDGYLYIALGDGGSGRDPHMNGQNLQTLLGSILRIDIDRQDQEGKRLYGLPADNPFVADKKFARGEIWAYGLRNPWRVTFDRETGNCWVADVGQDHWEEINIVHSGGNYGWNVREGQHPHGPGGTKARADLMEPIWEYHHDVGKSITGGYVYRGNQVPEIQGAYLYADWVKGQVWALWYDLQAGRVTANRTIQKQGIPVLTFGEDNQGEIYFGTEGGGIYHFRSPAK
jgi:glucose/arabinose dehydrogenase